jgi:hypothetical protein
MFYSGFKCFFRHKCFRHMFEVFHFSSDIFASVASGSFKTRSGVASPSSHSAALPQCLILHPAPVGHPNQRHRRALLPPPLLNASDVRGGTGPHVSACEIECRCGRPDASTVVYQHY